MKEQLQREEACALDKGAVLSRHGLSSGFTLIELLVSMTILGLLSLAILFGFRVGINAWNKSESGLERVRSVQGAFDLLNRQIASMVPYYSSQRFNDTSVDVLLFQGTENGMRFVSTFSAYSRSAGGLRLVEYFLAESKSGKGKALVVNDVPLPDDSNLSPFVISEITRAEDNTLFVRFQDFGPRTGAIYLMEDMESIQFRYFQRRRLREGEVQSKPRAAQLKEMLPPGVEIKLHWAGRGPFSNKDFSLTVPILSTES